jgi:hypothetical protein
MNKTLCRTITLKNGDIVEIKSWSDGYGVHLAGFNSQDKQVTKVKYSASVTADKDFSATFQTSVIDTLADAIENDLKTNPGVHYAP